MKNLILFLFLTLLADLSVFAGGQKRKVLVIGIDGTRSDALMQANTPSLDSLIANGFTDMSSWHCDITVSGPSWSSIMCGVYSLKHGVRGNSYSGSNYNSYPYFPKRAKELKPNLKCIQYTEWAPMSDNVYNDGWDLKLKGPDGATSTTGDAAVTQIQDPDVDVLFTYFDAVDLTGHSTGFSPGNPAYINAIEGVDVQVGRIISAMKNRPTYAQEDWLVLMTTDHGGINTGHGGNSVEERKIWWIGYSERGVINQISGPDPGTYNVISLPIIPYIDVAKQKQAPVQADIAVTALHHLIYETGVNPETQPGWNLDGRSWLCEMGLCDPLSVNRPSAGQVSLEVYPNPGKGRFTLQAEELMGKEVWVSLLDLTGRMVYQKMFFFDSAAKIIELENVSAGTYHLMVQSGPVHSATLLSIH